MCATEGQKQSVTRANVKQSLRARELRHEIPGFGQEDEVRRSEG